MAVNNDIMRICIESLCASKKPKVRRFGQDAKFLLKLPKVAEYLGVIERNLNGIYTPLNTRIVDDAFDAVTILYTQQIDLLQITQSERQEQKRQLRQTREIGKLASKILLFEIGILIPDGQESNPHSTGMAQEQYQEHINERFVHFVKDYERSVQQDIPQLVSETTDDKIRQRIEAVNKFYNEIFCEIFAFIASNSTSQDTF